MANWIQGHNDQFGFKAIVCHDGIFDTSTSYYTTEVSSPTCFFPRFWLGIGEAADNRRKYGFLTMSSAEIWSPVRRCTRSTSSPSSRTPPNSTLSKLLFALSTGQ